MIGKAMLIFPASLTLKSYFKELTPPLGIAYLGAVLKENGFQVNILDATADGWEHEEVINNEYIRYGLSLDSIRQRIKDFSPDVLGVSCLLSSQYREMHGICKIAKDISRDMITIVGGEHPSSLPHETLKDKNIDFVVLGEGEMTFRDLLVRMNKGWHYNDLDGLAFRDNGKIKINPKKMFIKDLDMLPFPARHLLPMQKYFTINRPQALTWRKRPNTSVITSRGCGARCIFCGTTRHWGNRFRARSAENVLKEIDRLIKEYGIKEVQFIDDNLLSDRGRALQLLDGLKERRLSWWAPHGFAVWTLDKELLRKLKDSGCYEITLGIDSADKRVLKEIIHKPLDIDVVPSLVKEMRRLRINTKAYFIVGFPGETKKEMKRTFRFARTLKFDAATFFIASPLPGTELYKICHENKYIKDGFTWQDLNFGKAVIGTEEFSPEEMQEWAHRETLLVNLRTFFINPAGFIRKFGPIILKNPSIFFNYFIALLRYTFKKNM
ncbi:B12-binding domain-containing radical SAM protein [Candidatus Omnitrophota bacterium]